ncbi:MAG: hypothetical protein JNM58_08545 [Xanthomonadaceae bacterium]|nr:hypothetical protein [Xanthomonadaceae bacterium]
MNSQARQLPRSRSAYQTALMVASWCALIGVIVACIAWLWPPRLNALVPLQRMDAYKQLTGYILVGLLSFDLSLALIKRRLVRAMWLRTLQLAHRILGLAMLVMLVLHAGFAHAGFLHATFAITMLVVVAGAALNLLPGEKLATWGQWTTALHIAAGCLLAALAVMHLYFVYTYAS